MNKILAAAMPAHPESLVSIKLVALPKSSDVVSKEATDQHILNRNEPVDYFQKKGIYAWANKNYYWQRNKAETTMSRYVTTFTDRLASRNVQSQKNEITFKCHILNTLMAVNSNSEDGAA